jgi:hypothetical protein
MALSGLDFTSIDEIAVDIPLGVLGTTTTETLITCLAQRGIELFNFSAAPVSLEHFETIGYAGTLGASSLLITSGLYLSETFERIRMWPPGLDSIQINLDEAQVNELINSSGRIKDNPLLAHALIGCQTARKFEDISQAHNIAARLPILTEHAHQTLNVANLLKPYGFNTMQITNASFVAGHDYGMTRRAIQSAFTHAVEQSLGIGKAHWSEVGANLSLQLVEDFTLSLHNSGSTDPFDTEENPAGLFLNGLGGFGSRLNPRQLIDVQNSLTARHGFMGILEEILRQHYPEVPGQIRNQ